MLHNVDFRERMGSRAMWLLAVMLAAGSSQALEISPPRLQSSLGQPLQVQIALRLSAGDKISKTLTDPCFKVDLSLGERQLKPGEFMRTIDWQVADGSIVMRLQTAAPVTEPLVLLSLGCPRQQYSLMLDPALVATPAAGSVASSPLRLPPTKTAPNAAAGNLPVAQRSGPPVRLSPGLRLDPGLAERAGDTLAATQGDWFAPLAGIRLLLALDVGGPAGATPEAHPGVEGPRPDRLKQAEAQFIRLQGEQKQLQVEMAQLSSDLLAREQRRAAGQAQSTGWLIGLAATATAALAAAGAWFWRRRTAAGRA